MNERRAQLFLYTESAQIDARTRKAMVAAGFLPVKVGSLDAVKFLEPAPVVPNAEISEILRAALDALLNTRGGDHHSDAWRIFSTSLAKRLIAAHDAADTAREIEA